MDETRVAWRREGCVAEGESGKVFLGFWSSQKRGETKGRGGGGREKGKRWVFIYF